MNLRGKPEALKQASWDAIRVWWVPVLARGKLHLELLGDEFSGENAQGAAILAAKVRTVLNTRFQGSTAPRVLFTDRGSGFYHQVSGSITKYKAALDAHSLRAYYGDNASAQPGNLQDVLLHETSVAWGSFVGDSDAAASAVEGDSGRVWPQAVRHCSVHQRQLQRRRALLTASCAPA